MLVLPTGHPLAGDRRDEGRPGRSAHPRESGRGRRSVVHTAELKDRQGERRARDPAEAGRARVCVLMPTPLNTGTVLWVFKDHDGGQITLRTRMGDELRFSLGATLTGHLTHGPLKAGDRLVVAAVSAPNGNTLVSAPCGCSLLLLVVPEA